MADFCQQCSLRLFGKDFRDLAELITRDEVAKGLMAIVLCEGCGPIGVDHEGRCVVKDCLDPKHDGNLVGQGPPKAIDPSASRRSRQKARS
jgi:hypothetical protein